MCIKQHTCIHMFISFFAKYSNTHLAKCKGTVSGFPTPDIKPPRPKVPAAFVGHGPIPAESAHETGKILETEERRVRVFCGFCSSFLGYNFQVF